MKLPENTGINEQAIELVEGKQFLYRTLYSLSLVEFETLGIYIKTDLKTEYFQPSKLLAVAFIFFYKKFDASLQIYINYWDVINLIIKNRYLLPLIDKVLDQLSQAKRFT